MTLFDDDIASRIAGRMIHEHGVDEDVEELFAMSVRLPGTTKALVDEMAENSGVSRNSMLIELVRAGIQSVLARLPDPVAEDIREGAAGRL